MPRPTAEVPYDEESQALLNNGEHHEEPNRFWVYLTWFWRFCIFGVTGSSSMIVTRFIIHHVFGTDIAAGIYYLVFFILEMVVYTVMLLMIGTCLGQRKFFCTVATKIWSWLIPSNWIVS